MRAERSASESSPVTRKASTPCLYVRRPTVRVQSVPHMHRSMPKASNRRRSGSQMSGYGNGWCESVQAAEILMATWSSSASEATRGTSAKGSSGMGG